MRIPALISHQEVRSRPTIEVILFVSTDNSTIPHDVPFFVKSEVIVNITEKIDDQFDEDRYL